MHEITYNTLEDLFYTLSGLFYIPTSKFFRECVTVGRNNFPFEGLPGFHIFLRYSFSKMENPSLYIEWGNEVNNEIGIIKISFVRKENEWIIDLDNLEQYSKFYEKEFSQKNILLFILAHFKKIVEKGIIERRKKIDSLHSFVNALEKHLENDKGKQDARNNTCF